MLAALALAVCASAYADVVDRIAVVVGPKVITESEVQEDLRLTEFLNQQPLDLSAAKRREAAEKMVDQQLIRNEMEAERYALPDPSRTDAMLANFRREHFKTQFEYLSALTHYGVTEAQVRQRLLWQLAVIEFTDARFQAELPLPPPPGVQTANRMRTGAKATPAHPQGDVDQVLEQWLKQQRGSTRVVFKQEAFQ